MKSFRILLRVVMVVVIVSLVLPACDMPWDDDGDKDKNDTEDPVSPLAPILGEHHYIGFDNQVMFNYEDEFGYEGNESFIGVFTESGEPNAWEVWLETLPGDLLKSLIEEAWEPDGDGYRGGSYKLYLMIMETRWELYITQAFREDNQEKHLWGIRGTHRLEPTGGDEYQGTATHTHKWSWNDGGKWDDHSGVMDFKIWIEADTWIRLHMKNDQMLTFQCPITRAGGLIIGQGEDNPIRIEL